MAFPCPFKTALGKRVVTPRIAARPALARGGEAAQTERTRGEGSPAHPAWR